MQAGRSPTRRRPATHFRHAGPHRPHTPGHPPRSKGPRARSRRQSARPSLPRSVGPPPPRGGQRPIQTRVLTTAQGRADVGAGPPLPLLDRLPAVGSVRSRPLPRCLGRRWRRRRSVTRAYSPAPGRRPMAVSARSPSSPPPPHPGGRGPVRPLPVPRPSSSRLPVAGARGHRSAPTGRPPDQPHSSPGRHPVPSRPRRSSLTQLPRPVGPPAARSPDTRRSSVSRSPLPRGHSPPRRLPGSIRPVGGGTARPRGVAPVAGFIPLKSRYPGRGHDGGALPPARPPPPLRGQPPPPPPHSSRVARRISGHTRLEATSTVTAADASSRTTMLSDAAFHCHRRRRECVANAGLGAGSAAGHDAAAVVTVTQSGGTVPQPPSPPSTTGQRRPRLHDRSSA